MPTTIPKSYAELAAAHRTTLREQAALQAKLRALREQVPQLAKALACEAFADGRAQRSEVSLEGRAAWQALLDLLNRE